MPVISLPQKTKRSFGWPQRLPLFPVTLLPAFLAFGAYLSAVANQFVYDDVYIIVENEALHSLRNLPAILTGSWWPDALYRPFTQFSFALDWAVSGGNPAYFHFVNIVLHVVCTVLVLRLAQAFVSRNGALVAACLFALHPVHVEAVANVVGRAEILATLFTLAAVLLYRFDGNAAPAPMKWFTQFGVLLLALLAYASKESALALPGILFLTDWWDSRARGATLEKMLRRHGVLLAATLVLALEWMWFRSSILGGLAGDHPGPGLFGEDFRGRVIAMAPVIVEWLRLLVFPLHLSADYSPNYLPQGFGFQAAAGVLAVVVLTVIGFRFRARFPVVGFALAWLGGTLLVVSNLLVPTGVLLAERSLYLPSVGLCLLAGWGVTHLDLRRLPVAAGVALVLGLALGRSVQRVGVWRDATTFFPQLVRDAQGSFRSYWVAGAIAYQLGNRAEGERLMRAAIDVYPIFPNVWNSLATEYERDERWADAGQFFAAAFRIDPTRANDAVSAVSNYLRAGSLDSAEAIVARARESGIEDYRLTVLLADVALRRDQPLRAMTLRRQVAFQMPQVWQYWYLTAEAAVAAGYCPEAGRSLSRVRQLRSDFDDQLDVLPRFQSMGCDDQ